MGNKSTGKSKRQGQGKEFHVRVSDGVGNSGIRDYIIATGGTAISKSQGVWFELQDLKTYVQDAGGFQTIVDRHTKHMKDQGVVMPVGSSWKVGFYWYAKVDPSGVTKLGFFVVPVLVLKDGGVLDYFNTQHNQYYAHPVQLLDDEFNVYDEGHLWP